MPCIFKVLHFKNQLCLSSSWYLPSIPTCMFPKERRQSMRQWFENKSVSVMFLYLQIELTPLWDSEDFLSGRVLMYLYFHVPTKTEAQLACQSAGSLISEIWSWPAASPATSLDPCSPWSPDQDLSLLHVIISLALFSMVTKSRDSNAGKSLKLNVPN